MRRCGLLDGRVAELEVVREEGPLGVVVRTVAGLGAGLDHVFKSGFDIEVARTECVGRRERITGESPPMT